MLLAIVKLGINIQIEHQASPSPSLMKIRKLDGSLLQIFHELLTRRRPHPCYVTRAKRRGQPSGVQTRPTTESMG
jgi:hypothetical protein